MLSPLMWTRGEMGASVSRAKWRSVDIVNFCGACGRHAERI